MSLRVEIGAPGGPAIDEGAISLPVLHRNICVLRDSSEAMARGVRAMEQLMVDQQIPLLQQNLDALGRVAGLLEEVRDAVRDAMTDLKTETRETRAALARAELVVQKDLEERVRARGG